MKRALKSVSQAVTKSGQACSGDERLAGEHIGNFGGDKTLASAFAI